MGERALVEDLVAQIAAGQVVAVVGAGVSISASGGAPAASWTGLLTSGVDRCEQVVRGLPPRWGGRVRDEICSGDLDDLLSAAEKVTSKLGGREAGEYRLWLRETVGQLELRDPAVPEALAGLGIPLVTTNYDGLLEQVTGLDPVTWRDGPRVQRILRGDEAGIVHLHGHWSQPESVVLGIRSYEDVLRDGAAQALLRALATFRSFLLVGFGAGLDDPNFAALRSWMAGVHAGSEYRHYRLVLDGDVEAVRAGHDARERIIVVACGARHEDLAGFLRGLGTRAPARVRRVGPAAGGAAERRYRELALRAFDIVDLANLPENDRHLATRELELRRLYVALQVEVEVPAEAGLEEAQLFALEERRFGRLLRSRTDGRRRVPVGQRLDSARRLVVLGDPGAGKTTLLRWLATAYLLRLGQDSDLAELPDAASLPDHDWLPVLVRCRDLGQAHADGSVGDALRHSLHKLELAPDECDAVLDAVRRRLEAGTALVLVDGLDEIADPTLRARFCRQLEQFHVAYPQAPMVVTSRIVGYRELGARIGRGFEHVVLSDLTRQEKDGFAVRWCALTELPERRAEAEAGLIRDLHSSPRIEELTGNPMLLTTMALVRRRVGKLPNRRVSLYEKAVEVLLNWRAEVDEPLDDDEALPQLHYLAYAMCDRGVQQLRHDQVVGLLGDLRREYPHLWPVARRDPEDFLRLLERRTGIVVESGEVRHDGRLIPVYEFRHLTFQEYLAGLALVCGHIPGRRDGGLDERVAPLAGRISAPETGEAAVAESWREPLRLCLAACNHDDVDGALLAVLLPAEGEDAAATARARAVQAARCLADEPNVTEGVAESVLQALVRHIGGEDGRDGAGTTLDTAVRELAASDLWARPLERRLCDEFQSRPPAARTTVAAVHGLVTDVLLPDDDTALADWLRAQVARLTSHDDAEAIAAALGVCRAADRQPFALHPVPEAGPVLMGALDRAGPVAHAAALALERLVSPYYVGSWMTTLDLRQLLAHLDDPSVDAGALAGIVSILGKRDFVLAAPMLVRHLSHPDADVGREAAVALGELGDHRAAEPLLTLLAGSDTTLWEAWALGLLSEHRAFEVLRERLGDPDAEMRQAVVGAFRQLGDVRAVEPLLGLLGDPDADVRGQAAVALGGLGDVRAVEPLLRLLNTDAAVRGRAPWVLGWLGDLRAVEPLLELLGNADPVMRWNAAEALGRLGDHRAVEPLLKLLSDDVAGVRWRTAVALGWLGDVRVVEPLVELLDDVNVTVRWCAAEVLGGLGDVRVVEPLVELLGDIDAKARGPAAGALGDLGDGRAVEPLLEGLIDADPLVRGWAAVALGGLGDGRALDPLLELLGDPNGRVRLAVARAVGKLGGDREVVALLERLTDLDDLVRAAVAAALGALGDARAVEPLLARLDDTEVDVRAAVAAALGRLGDRRAVE
ncbi:MAG: HEAT repeat domain-containing protein, partial [Egibacteraceae bacterium]